jgi:hypothetical protein
MASPDRRESAMLGAPPSAAAARANAAAAAAAVNGRPDREPSLGAAAGRRLRRGWLVRRMLLAADVVGLTIAFVLVEVLFRGTLLLDNVGAAVESAIFVGLLPVWAVAAKVYGLYDRDEERATHSTTDEIVNVFHLLTVGVWLFFATSWIVGLANPSQQKLASFWGLALVTVIGGRSVARALARRQSAYVQNALIIGAGEVGQLIGRKLRQHPEYRINLVGFIDASPTSPSSGSPRRSGRSSSDIESTASLLRSRWMDTSRCSSSFEGSASTTCRLTSFRACSKRSAQMSTSTRSRVCRCSAYPRVGSRVRRDS